MDTNKISFKKEQDSKPDKDSNFEKKLIKILISSAGLLILYVVIILIFSPQTFTGNTYQNLNTSPPANNYTPPPAKKNSLTPEEIRIQNKKEAEERMKRDREESQKKYQEGLDKRQKEIDKMSNIDYYMYHGNPNHLSFEELEKMRKEASEDYWKNRKK